MSNVTKRRPNRWCHHGGRREILCREEERREPTSRIRRGIFPCDSDEVKIHGERACYHKPRSRNRRFTGGE
jgi:hypothetical protein